LRGICLFSKRLWLLKGIPEYIGEVCSMWVESNQLDGIFHLMITEFKLDANRDIEDEIKFGTVLSIEEMKEFHRVLSEALDH